MSLINQPVTVFSIPRRSLPPSYTPIDQQTSHPSSSETEKQAREQRQDDLNWTIGWKSPSAMIACYVAALLFSIAHLSMLIYLNDRPVSNYPQSYVTTASTILSSFFGLTLKAALAIAFTQCLWSILRKSAQKLQTVEDLFTMRSTPYLAFRGAILKCAPMLSLFTIVLWSLEIATTFPPGALTVVSQPHVTNVTAPVMALNTSFIGNGSGTNLQDTAIAVLRVSSDDKNVITGIQQELTGSGSQVIDHRGSVLRLASHTMISRSITTSPTPCGLNCTYSLQFTGPYILCSQPQNTTNTLIVFGDDVPIYVGVWSNPADDNTIPYEYQIAFDRRAESTSVATFNITLFEPLGFNEEDDLFTRMTTQVCKPAQATYNVNVTYEDGVQAFDIRTIQESIRPLMDVTQPAPRRNCSKNCDCCGELTCSCGPGIQWSDGSLKWLSDANNMAIIESMTLALAGQYNVDMVAGVGGDFDYTLDDGYNVTLLPVVTGDNNYNPVLTDEGPVITSSGPLNGTIIASTAINLRVNDYNISEGPQLVMNEDILNEMLQNITISLMNTFPLWKRNVTATQNTLRNVYSFSNKINLLLPYYLSLAIALPLLAFGGLSLLQNGVSATDGGFLQILTTTATSETLNRIAARGALGGSENIPQELKDLKIRYGELIDDGNISESLRRRKVGFGVEGEVTNIRKGVKNGSSRNERKSVGSVQSAETSAFL